MPSGLSKDRCTLIWTNFSSVLLLCLIWINVHQSLYIHGHPRQIYFFPFLLGIFEGSAIPAHSEKLPNWHFFTPIWFFLIKWLHLKQCESAILCFFLQNVSQAPSMCISTWIKVNKWNYLKNPTQEFKSSFYFRFLWISRMTGRKN